MGGLVKAEFRKVLTTHLWWALLIPVAVISFSAGWAGTAVGSLGSLQAELGKPLPLGLLTVSLSTNFCTIFAAIFGVIAMSGEYRHKSITTTYLTGSPRGAVLGAKLIAYTNMGLVFGLVNVLFASLGGLIGAGSNGFGNAGDWFAVGAAGVLAMVLWTLFGVGFGALLTNAVASIVVLLVYTLMVEGVVSLMLRYQGWEAVPPYLPNASGGGIVSNLSVPIFMQELAGPSQPVPKDAYDAVHGLIGGSYGHPWWASMLTFAGYAAALIVAGWLVGRQRDIT